VLLFAPVTSVRRREFASADLLTCYHPNPGNAFQQISGSPKEPVDFADHGSSEVLTPGKQRGLRTGVRRPRWRCLPSMAAGAPVESPAPTTQSEKTMSKYLYLYRGPATQMDNLSEEESAAQMKAWGDWIGRLGPKLVDVGNPFGARTAIVDDGTSRETGDVNGYSIVEADNLEVAKELADNHPFLTEGKGRFAVEVFELVPM